MDLKALLTISVADKVFANPKRIYCYNRYRPVARLVRQLSLLV
ncbi:Molybdenum transport regulatory protein ModE [Moritella viscosa]|uniref:Molybdenum transport regulatory protein ModE n=1 Tax=Moritella viscosa TaxID=80854 RepID=A0A1L0A3G4_9GAMM|nr:Molybdenum transport regulatory protein ModE [Moritella viscosa]SHO10430.1 Molybdenum transport regulatory protein ModE [Moritella viscosa]SHO10442.1 Molybdenum transport regulatory protein ModE [Moritella viscosa]SHO15623.1 Molybdenum transport regulatory protein ModE [Moritella viscosa]SHO17443.1 Molybdenum transport regulatory protein ModE [Moritella viscosa]